MRHTKLLFLDSDRTKAGANVQQKFGKTAANCRQKEISFKIERQYNHTATCTVNCI